MYTDDNPLPAEDISEHGCLEAGEFSSFLHHARSVLAAGNGTSVDCDGCYACCSASTFIHIRPHKTRTLDKIQKDLLFPAPGMPEGHVLLGYDKNGRCPVLTDGRCSI